MLHIHFGAGRLGLGLIAPFFQTPDSELFILNRAVSASKPSGADALSPDRRNALLRDNPDRVFVIQEPGDGASARHVVHYNGFHEYDSDAVDEIIGSIIDHSERKQDGVVVTAALLSAGNYRPVLAALSFLADLREREQVGPIFLVACENAVSAHDVFQDADLCEVISDLTRRHVTCLHALVDRVCVGLEEGQVDDHPAVLVRAEEYGSLKLELPPGMDDLERKLQGSRVEFSRHVAVEKQIKSWLLNGTHWLLALRALQDGGSSELKLNEFLAETPEHRAFAEQVMQEMRDGVAVILRTDPKYADFVKDVDAEAYLDGAAAAILKRFMSNEDPISRILARFQEPTAESPSTIEAFSKRLSDRVDEPISAYVAEKGVAPPATTQSVQSLLRLIASGKFINAG